MSLIPTYDLLLKGVDALIASGDAAERSKQGTLRAGNTGLLLPDGRVVGKCGRLSALRSLGIDTEAEDRSRQLMFQAGHSNEDNWAALLLAAGLLPEDILREEQTPISWPLPSGRIVTGRPDFVLKGQRGLELKQVSSLWTARDVALKGVPKTMHLLQAAHYFWKTGVPEWELWYTSRADFALPSDYKWGADKKWPRPGQPGAEYMQMSEEGYPIKMLPFLVGYEMRWRGATPEALEYRRVPPRAGSVWVPTIISKTGIEAYYKQVDSCMTRDLLPPRPLNLNPDGSLGSYGACQYCPLANLCDAHAAAGRKELSKWTAEAAAVVAGLASKGTI